MEKQQRVANIFIYQLGQLPMKYLGLPISDHVSPNDAVKRVTTKMTKRIESHKGKQLSTRGRLILLESFLSNVLIYRVLSPNQRFTPLFLHHQVKGKWKVQTQYGTLRGELNLCTLMKIVSAKFHR